MAFTDRNLEKKWAFLRGSKEGLDAVMTDSYHGTLVIDAIENTKQKALERKQTLQDFYATKGNMMYDMFFAQSKYQWARDQSSGTLQTETLQKLHKIVVRKADEAHEDLDQEAKHWPQDLTEEPCQFVKPKRRYIGSKKLCDMEHYLPTLWVIKYMPAYKANWQKKKEELEAAKAAEAAEDEAQAKIKATKEVHVVPMTPYGISACKHWQDPWYYSTSIGKD